MQLPIEFLPSACPGGMRLWTWAASCLEGRLLARACFSSCSLEG